MTFGKKLDEYIGLLQCSQKQLARVSGIPPSIISRYRSGILSPSSDTEGLQRLIAGIVRLAEEKGIRELTQDFVSHAFLQIIEADDLRYERLRQNLNSLLSAFPFTAVTLARNTSYNVTSISRLRSGQRRPMKPALFALEVAQYVVRSYPGDRERAILAKLMGCDFRELMEDDFCTHMLAEWLFPEDEDRPEAILPFLTKLDGFDWNEAAESLSMGQMKIPPEPSQPPDFQTYSGLAEMRQGYLDFFRAATTSRSRKPLIINDDTPISDLTTGTDFMRQFSIAVALVLKKGLHINVIHDVNRPFDEMLIGLEGWLPMYMTGQISPYYLKRIPNPIFGHVLFSSGTAALSGECILGYHENGRFYLTRNKEDVAYYRTRAENLLSKASPLMDIYRVETEEQYQSFLQTDEDTPGTRRSILTAPPLYTISEQLMTQIMKGKGLSKEVLEQVLAHAARQKERMERILERDTVTDEIPVLPEAPFAQQPLTLPLSEMFCERDIPYTYGEYLEHLEQTKTYAEEHPNYTAVLGGAHTFRNIQIAIHEGKWAVVSRNKAPAIHFVVRHPKLLNAIEHFIPPMGKGL